MTGLESMRTAAERCRSAKRAPHAVVERPAELFLGLDMRRLAGLPAMDAGDGLGPAEEDPREEVQRPPRAMRKAARPRKDDPEPDWPEDETDLSDHLEWVERHGTPLPKVRTELHQPTDEEADAEDEYWSSLPPEELERIVREGEPVALRRREDEMDLPKDESGEPLK